MQIYLPIAEVSVNIFLLIGLGALVGFLSGMFGVGGGFLMTPLLIFIGIPPAVAVSTEANQIVASSTSGALAHWRRRTLDLKLGCLLLLGGMAGSFVGVQTFSVLKGIGQIDLVISLSYVFFLGLIGMLMLIESLFVIFRRGHRKKALQLKIDSKTRTEHVGQNTGQKEKSVLSSGRKIRFSLKRLFHLKISIIAPIILGFLVGFLAAIMGVGGGFIIVPAMIYLLRIPTNIVVGTSLFQILFVTAFVTFLQAVQNNTVDIVLAACLIVGGAVGAQIGAQAGRKVRAEELRALLSLIVLSVCIRMGWQLFAAPDSLYTVVM